MPLLAADIATAGTINVGVKNPPPGGGLSVTTQPLAVQAETTDPTVTIGGADAAWHNDPVPLTFSGSDSQVRRPGRAVPLPAGGALLDH